MSRAEHLGPAVSLRAPDSRRVRAWEVVAGLLAASAALTLIDAPLTHQIGQLFPDGSPQRQAIKFSNWALDWTTVALLPILLLLFRNWRPLIIGFGVYFVSVVGLLHLTKFIVGRARPHIGLGPFYFWPLGDQARGFDSFPSGHAAAAALLAFLLGHYWPTLRWPLVAVAGLVCVARVAQARHYPSDTLAALGMTLGVFLLCRGFLGARYYPRLTSPRGPLEQR